MARKKKFYAVKVGRKPGICTEWFGRNSAETQVKDYPIAIFIGFPRLKKNNEALHVNVGVKKVSAKFGSNFQIT